MEITSRLKTSRPMGASRRWTAGLAVAALMFSLGACSGDEPEAAVETETVVPTPPPSPSPEPTPEPTETETATEEPEPEEVGTPLEGGPVLAVKIDQVDAAYPRTGLASADVIYVDQVEYGLTRLMAVFSSTLPERVGPVRSARPNDPTILANYGPVALAFAGASGATFTHYLDVGTQINVSHDGGGFHRDNSRAAPHNLYGTPSVLLERADGSQPPGDVGFRYGDPAPGGTPATAVSTRYPATRMSAAYQADSGTYEVSTNGRVEIDTLTGEPVTPTTIVIQKLVMENSLNGAGTGNATPLAGLVGSGEAIVLRDGQVWNGAWERA
ncbi:MAG: DUF3048 domain-containing protein, partial [Actinomycetia bacterium]|nr:DUF3048 domain-containing protein [Actinomycetes bacterium]